MEEETDKLEQACESVDTESLTTSSSGHSECLERIETLNRELEEKQTKIKKLQKYIQNVEEDGDRLSNELIIANSFRECFNKIASPMMMVDQSLTITYANQSFYDMTGTGPDILEQKTKCNDILKCDVQRDRCLLENCFGDGSSVSGEECGFVSSCGRKFTLTVDAFPIKNLATNEILGGIEFYQKVVEDTTRQFLMFTLRGQEFGINVENLIEIVSETKMVPVPRMPDFMYGVIRLRDGVFPAMNLARRLGLEEAEASNDRPKVVLKIVTGRNKATLCLGVDEVREIVTLTGDQIERLHALDEDASSGLVYGIAKQDQRSRVLIDADVLYDWETHPQVDLEAVCS